MREVGRIEPDLEIDAVRSWNLSGACSMKMDEPIRRRFPFYRFKMVDQGRFELRTSLWCIGECFG